MTRHVPIRDADGKIKDMVPESDAAFLALLDIEEEEEQAAEEQPVAEPPAPPAKTKPRSLADLLPPDPAAPAQPAQPAPEPLSAQAKAQTVFVVLFVIIAFVGGMQFLQPRTAATLPASQATATLAPVNEAALPTSAPVATVQAYAAPDGSLLGPVPLAGLPAPIGRYGSSDWLYFEFAPPVGAVWLKAGDLGMQVDPALKDMRPVPTAEPAPWSPPVAPAWTEPVAESAPAEAAPINAPDLHPQPTIDIEAIVTDPAGETENAIKKMVSSEGGPCRKNKQTGETTCTP